MTISTWHLNKFLPYTDAQKQIYAFGRAPPVLFNRGEQTTALNSNLSLEVNKMNESVEQTLQTFQGWDEFYNLEVDEKLDFFKLDYCQTGI